MSNVVIAIDGPAGSGKSTTANLAANKLGFVYLDTGAMYRAITLKCLRLKKDINNEKEMTKIAENSSIKFQFKNGTSHIYLDGKDVTLDIRQPEIDKNVSILAKHPKVRKVLVTQQKSLSQNHNLVAEGRDTTTVVFPLAIKIYLTADLKERAKRRFLELESKGIKSSLEEQINEISRRDKLDSTRQASPLLLDKDAIVVDTTDLTIDQQVERVVEIYKKKMKIK
jgi:CMP/dCMP kinase